MLSCWRIKDTDRPLFNEILRKLKNIYESIEEASWLNYPSNE